MEFFLSAFNKETSGTMKLQIWGLILEIDRKHNPAYGRNGVRLNSGSYYHDLNIPMGKYGGLQVSCRLARCWRWQ